MSGAAAAPRAATASLLVAFAACCFGSISVLTVLATREGTALTTLLFWRYALASVLLLPLARRSRSAATPAPRTVLTAGAGQAAIAFLTLSALRWIPAATLGFLFYTFPAWVTLFAALRGTERVDGRRVLALALSLGGIVLTVGAPSGGGGLAATWPGIALALGAALDGTFAVALPPVSWGAAVTLAVLCTVIAFQAFLRGLTALGPVRTAIVSTVEPFWTALLGAAVLDQGLTPATLGGGALIATAVLLLQLPARPAPAAA